jgi:lysophospholipase
METFRLSDPGSALALDPAMAEYLRAYDFPQPPLARYGFTKLRSPQDKSRVALFAQAWVPMHASATVALVHGYSEHCGLYAKLIRELVDARFAVITMDLRGHGLSEGPAGHAPTPHVYAEDAERVINEIFPLALPNSPLFLFGHSLGGMTALQLLLRGKLPVEPRATVLTSPLLGFPELKGVQKFMAAFAPLLSKIAPALPIAHGIPPYDLSHDEVYLARRYEDPLVRRVATPRWFESAKAAVAELQENADKFAPLSPTLLMLAGSERITNLQAARRFAFRAYAGQRHKVIEFPGMFHELEKEPEVRARVVSETIAWLKSHL